jgi:hypothetical protein
MVAVLGVPVPVLEVIAQQDVGIRAAAGSAELKYMSLALAGVIVTDEVSARVPPTWTAMTRKLPVVFPAVNSPPAEIVPPVALQVTAGLGSVPPPTRLALAVNC